MMPQPFLGLRALGDVAKAGDAADWLAFDSVHGLPDPWRQAGVVAKAASDPWRKKGDKPVRPEDFIPAARPKARPKRQSNAEIRAAMRGLAPTKKEGG